MVKSVSSAAFFMDFTSAAAQRKLTGVSFLECAARCEAGLILDS